MREESQAPRNSRELAVRNQFFTPRYVVQFLTDNTLGRIWYRDARRARPRSPSRCEYLVRTPGRAVRARARRRTRATCASSTRPAARGHFLLYAFDLLLAIYEEAWADPDRRGQRGDGPDARATTTRASTRLRRALPALILEHNLHGVDIDPRCAQIAALALWLRAQRACQDARHPGRPSDRGSAARTSSSPSRCRATRALVEEFAATLDPPLLGDALPEDGRRDAARRRARDAAPGRDAASPTRSGRRAQQYVRQQETTGYLPGLRAAAEPGRARPLADRRRRRSSTRPRSCSSTALRQIRRVGRGSGRRAAAALRRRRGAGRRADRPRADAVRRGADESAVRGVRASRRRRSSRRRTRGRRTTSTRRSSSAASSCSHQRGMLGAITSRTGFFLSSFQKWREEILLKEAPPVVVRGSGLRRDGRGDGRGGGVLPGGGAQ